MTEQKKQIPDFIEEIDIPNAENECEGYLHENVTGGGEGAVSSEVALASALQYWRDILTDPKASDTAKMNAANGLSRFGQAELGSHGGKLHQMSRSELQAEIARVRKSLGLV